MITNLTETIYAARQLSAEPRRRPLCSILGRSQPRVNPNELRS